MAINCHLMRIAWTVFFPSSTLMVAIGNVKFEITSSSEARLAVTAAVGSVVRVNVHMELQIGQLIEGLLAEIAPIRLLSGMDEYVIAQVALLMEALAANVADELLHFAVGANVRLQRGRPIKGLVADVALVRLF